MNVKQMQTKPILNQKPGTGGLRKKTSVFMEPDFVENFVQASLNVRIANGDNIDTWVIGGDGRYPGMEFLPRIIKILVANGVKKVIVVGKDLVAPTPAISNVIRKYKADGGFILSASHNPAGVNGDFGIKVEMSNGGGAPEAITDAIYENTTTISFYNTLEITDEEALGLKEVEYVDPIKDYIELMESMFDLDIIKKWFEAGNTFRFDAMNASSGPLAIQLFVNRLGAKPEWILNSIPMSDFGGLHPEPNPTYAKDIYDFMMNGGADFGCACDGDGDRNMVLGKGVYIAPSDSLAVLTKYHKLVKYYRDGLKGVARTLPTSSAVDLVADKMGIEVYKTPTGWKFFSNLLDSNKIGLCGEESFGQGGDYIREKDGIFPILFWLNILSVTGKTASEIVEEMWNENGRVFYSQYSYENVDKEKAEAVMENIRNKSIDGKEFGNFTIETKEVFNYTDPTNGEVIKNQGIQVLTTDGTRAFFRLSGTGTVGATMRFYVEKFEKDQSQFSIPTKEYLKDVYKLVEEVFEIKKYFGNIEPDAIN